MVNEDAWGTLSFRRKLKSQLPILLEKGIIEQQQANKISEFYSLENAKNASAGMIVSIIYIAGAILMGIGVISFVAYHWQQIPCFLRFAIIITAMLIAYSAGYYLQFIRQSHEKLGGCLILLGAICFGANIGLTAQIFNISGVWYGLFLPWAAGALFVGLVAKNLPCIFLSLITAFIWSTGLNCDYLNYGYWFLMYGITVIFVTLSIYYRSGLLFAATVFSHCVSGLIFMPNHTIGDYTLAFILPVGATLYNSAIFFKGKELLEGFDQMCQTLGIAICSITLFVIGFKDVTEEYVPLVYDLKMLTVIPVILVMLFSAFFAIKAEKKIVIDTVFSIYLPFIALIIPVLAMIDNVVFNNIVANIFLFTTSAILLSSAMINEGRASFWAGAVLLAAHIFSRTVEYDTGLLIKSLAFLLCGAGFITAGLLFERYLAKSKVVK